MLRFAVCAGRAPAGFIVDHSHHDGTLEEEPVALAAVREGSITILAGQDGPEHRPLPGWFAALDHPPVAIKVASVAGRSTIRDRMLDGDPRRQAGAEPVGRMRSRLHEMVCGDGATTGRIPGERLRRLGVAR